MTDEELIARLRDAPADGLGTENLCLAAADCIEALIAEREKLGREVNMARYGQPDFAWSIHKEVVADLEAKLAKAVEALDAIRFFSGVNVAESDLKHVKDSVNGVAEKALATIKGESHE